MNTLAALRHKNFIDVDGGYGFDQTALREKWSAYRADRACGIATLANLIAYKEKKRAFDKNDALRFMSEILLAAPPRPWGIAAGGILVRAMGRMGRKYRAEFLKARAKDEEIKAFLLRALNADRPVALLNTNHPNKSFRYHWVTITEMVEEEGEVYVRFSSWGRRYKMRFEDLFVRGMMYRSMFFIK